MVPSASGEWTLLGEAERLTQPGFTICFYKDLFLVFETNEENVLYKYKQVDIKYHDKNIMKLSKDVCQSE